MIPYLKAAQYEPKTPNEHIEGVSVLLPLEGRSGFVFVLAYVDKKNPDNDVLLQLLSDQAHRLASSFGKDANAQHRFEQFLGALNESLSETVREGRFYIPIQNFHATVGIICEDRMFLSGTGELSALFLHRKPSQRYQIFNLFRGIQTEQAFPTWEKPFAIVLDGDLEDGDVFCVSQKDIQRHISQDDLNSILTALPPTSGTEKIRQYFPANDGLLLIIIKAEASFSSVPESYAKPLSDVSIDSFVHAQDETSKLLADQKPNIFGFLKTRFILLYKKWTEKSRILSDLERGQPRMKIFLGLCKSIFQNSWKTLKRSGKGVSFFIAAIGNKERRETLLKSVPSGKAQLKDTWFAFVKKMRTLPVRTIRFLQILSGLTLILIIGLVSLSHFKTTSEAQRNYDQKVSTIQDTLDRAGGAMIYKDENQARSLYQQATTFIQQLPKDTPAHQETIVKLTKDVETAMNELRHVVTIPDPILVAHLESAPGLEQKGISLVRSGTNLYVVDTNQKILQIDPATKQYKTLTPNPISTSPIINTSEEDGSIFALDQQGGLYTIDAKTGTVGSVSITNTSGKAISITSYARRLYLLAHTTDNQDIQILKFTRAGTGYGNGSSWISSKTETLADARAMTIDGAMYVLRADGRIARFQNGAEVGWQLGIVDPPATEATHVWTNPDSLFIYILDPKTKRLIVFKKDTGAFVVQYTSDTFMDLSDFTVDEKAQTIYLLSGSNVYTISAGHLKK